MPARKKRRQDGVGGRVASAAVWFLQEFTYRGRTVVVGATLLAIVVGTTMWISQRWSEQVTVKDKYAVSVDDIRATPPPEWLEVSVVEQALGELNLDGRLSVLNEDLAERVAGALLLHPWVEAVQRVETRFPAGVEIDLIYRRPFAAIESSINGESQFCAIDPSGVRLPSDDLPELMLRRLPRIGDVGQLPLIGQKYEGKRVEGAIEILKALREVWEPMQFLRVQPALRAEIRGESKYYVYDVLTRGGTIVHWGAAPGLGPPSETPPAEKLARLKSYVREHGPLDSSRLPQRIEVRDRLSATPYVAEKSEATIE